MKHNAHVFKYIPDILTNLKFEKIAQELGIREETYESMKLFDQCLKNLFKQADDAGDYLRMIVKNFEGITDQENTKHLRLFYTIIPPLTLSYIDHL